MNKLVKLTLVSIFALIFFQSANAQSYTQNEQNCFNMVQNKVAYDKAGDKVWAESNIRNLCKGTTNPAATISCFTNVINNFNDWNRGIRECSALALSSQSANLSGNWDGYFPANTKTAYVWQISQSGSSLAFMDVGAGTNTRFSGTRQGNSITDSNNVTGTLSADGSQIVWANGVIWKKQGSASNNQINAIQGDAPLTTTSLTSTTSDFYMAFVGDPQLWWQPSSPYLETDFQSSGTSLEAKSAKINQNQIASIKKLRSDLGADKVKGVIINGDLTSYGHSNELDKFKELWINDTGLPKIYPGLGNHDYANNLGDCSPDCGNRMLQWLFFYLRGLKTINTPDMSVTAGSLANTGSLAYSWDIGNVHFVQLNNYPAFTARIGSFNIKPSMDWLDKDLAAARRDGKAIILNMHDLDEHFKNQSEAQRTEFAEMCRTYKVSAVFFAHTHNVNKDTSSITGVQVFNVGSPMSASFMYAHFNGSQMTVTPVQDKSGGLTAQSGGPWTVDLLTPKENLTPTDRSATATYKVKIVTGSNTDDGTDANIYISFTGTKAQSGEYQLDDSKNNFEKGDIDEFTLNNVEDVGELKGFNIRSDQSGSGSDWYLQSVEITKGGKFFHKTVSKLVAENKKGEQTQYYGVSETPQMKYTVKLKTADVGDAGTDSNIALKIYGLYQSTDMILLNPQISGNAFERGKTDSVSFTDIDVGTISKIEIQSDHLYAGADWNLESVTIDAGGKSYTFPANYNFADTQTHSFTPGELQGNYSLSIKTADKSGAGTDSNIYLVIKGDNGNTQEQHLNSKISGNAFERNNTDSLIFTDKDVGNITSISIRSDTKYAGSDWDLESLTITYKNKQYIFRPNTTFSDTSTKVFYVSEIK